MQKKGFIVFSSLFTIIFLVGAGCAQVQSNTNTEDTTVNKTAQETENDFSVYQSDKMKVSFEYPTDWSIIAERVDSSWDMEITGATAGVTFNDGNGKEIVVGRKLSRTINQELEGASEIEYELVDELAIADYRVANVVSSNLFTKVTTNNTWLEKDGDLMKLPSINAYPEVEHIIESLQFTK